MKPILIFLLFLLCQPGQAQRLWTEVDRQYTVENLRRTRDELSREVENLTDAQWNFRQAPGRWTIAEIVEHLGLWEIAWAREIGEGLHSPPRPDLAEAQKAASPDPDKYYRDFIMEDKPHQAPPFAEPTGLIPGKNTLAFFRLKRDQAIAFAETTPADMRAHYERTDSKSPRNMHQVYIYQWGHVDRHLRQIRQVEAHPNYPK